MPLQATSGAASQDAFGGNGVAVVPNYIEDVFSTYLYTGNDSSQTITNGIDLSTKGGLVWIKSRNATYSHILSDTNRGTGKFLSSNTTDAQGTDAQDVTAFNTTGFTVGNNSRINNSSFTYASWTFRKQPKFFDVVTYTGDGSTSVIAHNLGSVPACIIVKKTSAAGNNWQVYHRSAAKAGFTAAQSRMSLNTTDAVTDDDLWTNTAPTSTNFYVKSGNSSVNAAGATYVAYLFAHDAGGFGLTGTDNVISCGSFTTNGSGVATVNLGYEPQFVLFKRTDSAGHSWEIIDTMRGFSVNSNGTTGNVQRLNANSSGAETNSSAFEMYLTSTGFATNQYFYNATYIYVAIRRGPMKVPTTGTSVYNAIARTGTNAAATVTGVGFPSDLAINGRRDGAFQGLFWDRLRAANRTMYANSNSSESAAGASGVQAFTMDGFTLGTNWDGENASGGSCINWLLRRAPSVFDIVCYSGTGSNTTQTHNLSAVPELIIVKGRSGATAWQVYSSALANTEYLVLNTTAAKATSATRWNSTTPTSSVFSLGTASEVNTSAATYVAYLFATCAGVSKVGSYTGTATTLQIDCGFTAGARFVLIKRTDSTGDWYVWDTARGIVSGNDSYLLLNSTAAEVTNTDYIDTYSAGFEISSTAPAAINANGGSFIFFAVA